MDNLSLNQLQKQAHDNAVLAGQKLAEAEQTLEKAEKIIHEANLRLSNARKFENVLKERQRKLDRAFILLNKQKQQLNARILKDADRQLLIDDNQLKY